MLKRGYDGVGERASEKNAVRERKAPYESRDKKTDLY